MRKVKNKSIHLDDSMVFANDIKFQLRENCLSKISYTQEEKDAIMKTFFNQLKDLDMYKLDDEDTEIKVN